jgi:hypothetical protein
MLKRLILFFLIASYCSCAGAVFRVAVISDLDSSYGSTGYHAGVGRAGQWLAAPKFTSMIPIHSLPEKITSPQATLIREDLVQQPAGTIKP